MATGSTCSAAELPQFGGHLLVLRIATGRIGKQLVVQRIGRKKSPLAKLALAIRSPSISSAWAICFSRWVSAMNAECVRVNRGKAGGRLLELRRRRPPSLGLAGLTRMNSVTGVRILACTEPDRGCRISFRSRKSGQRLWESRLRPNACPLPFRRCRPARRIHPA